MKLQLAALPLVLLAAVASAEPPPAPRPAAAPTCKPTGGVLFAIDHKVDPGAKLATSSTKLYGNGAWTHDETDAEGKALAPTAGCLAKTDTGQLETALKAAPWTVTKARMHCMAMSSQFTVFTLNGKTVFTQRLCSGDVLDAKSKAALDAAVAQLERKP